MKHQGKIRKGSTMPTGFESDDNVGDGERAEEEHHQQEAQVKVVASGCLEDDLVWNVGHQHRPRLDVHDEDQLDDVDKRKTGGHEQSHPNCTPEKSRSEKIPNDD